MPTYQYACTSCGEALEVVQKFSDDPLTVCPTCEGRLRKLFSAVGVVFKGSGFYKTDSRAKSSSGSSASKPSEPTAKPSESSSDKGASAATPSSSDSSSGGSSSSGDKVA